MAGKNFSPFLTVESNTLKLQDTEQIDQNVIQIESPAIDTLTLSADVTFSGIFALFLVGLHIPFQVHYLFSPIGPGAGGEFVGSPVPVTTAPGQLVYDGASANSTKLVLKTDAAHLPPPGLYRIAARVSFGPGAPISTITNNEIDLETFA